MSTATIEFQDAIIPESATAEPDETPAADPNVLECVVCGKPLTYAGRGAKPKYCDDHKTRRSSTPTPGGSSRTSKDERIRKELTSTLAMLGLGVMTVDQYDGLVIIDRSADTVNALMTVAEHNPRVRKALEQMLEVSVWAALGVALAGMAVPIAVHHGILPLPQETVEAQFLSEDTQRSLARMRERKATGMPVPEPSNEPSKTDVTDPTTW